MNITEENLHRVRLQWTDESRTQVMAVADPDGPFIMKAEYDGCVRYKPKTYSEQQVEKADRGEFPVGTDPEIERTWGGYWVKGWRVAGGIWFEGMEEGPKVEILDYWYFDDTHTFTSPKRVLVDGVLYNIPRPTDPPKEDEDYFSLPVSK